jgi:hypothetical protein
MWDRKAKLVVAGSSQRWNDRDISFQKFIVTEYTVHHCGTSKNMSFVFRARSSVSPSAVCTVLWFTLCGTALNTLTTSERCRIHAAKHAEEQTRAAKHTVLVLSLQSNPL